MEIWGCWEGERVGLDTGIPTHVHCTRLLEGTQGEVDSKYLCWAGGVIQEVECLCSNYEALSSNPSATKKKKLCCCRIYFLHFWQTHKVICPFSIFLFLPKFRIQNPYQPRVKVRKSRHRKYMRPKSGTRPPKSGTFWSILNKWHMQSSKRQESWNSVLSEKHLVVIIAKKRPNDTSWPA
jgi:hypothetical protein